MGDRNDSRVQRYIIPEVLAASDSDEAPATRRCSEESTRADPLAPLEESGTRDMIVSIAVM